MKKLLCLLVCLYGFSVQASQFKAFTSLVTEQRCPTPDLGNKRCGTPDLATPTHETKDTGFRSIAMMENNDHLVPSPQPDSKNPDEEDDSL